MPRALRSGSDDWLARWLEAPNIPMPNQNLSDAEIKQYLAYFHWFDSQPAGSVKSSGGGH